MTGKVSAAINVFNWFTVMAEGPTFQYKHMVYHMSIINLYDLTDANIRQAISSVSTKFPPSDIHFVTCKNSGFIGSDGTVLTTCIFI